MATLDELLVAIGIDTEELTSGAQGAADEVESSLGGIQTAAAGAAVGGLFMSGLNSAMDASSANSRLQQQLGLTEGEAQRAGDIAGQVFRAGFGESIDAVNESLGSVISSIDGMSEATDKELASMSTSALRLADLYEIDVADAAQAAGTMISNGLAKDGTEAFDVLTVAAQKLPKQMLEDIPATVNEYGKSWSRIGLDAKDAFGLMSQYVNAGGRDIDQAGDVLHEFARITSEETDRAAAGFKGLGLDSKQMLADIGKGGEPARAALSKTLEALRGVKDPAKQAALGVELFGDMAGEGGSALWAMDPASAAASSGIDNVKGAADAANAAMAGSASQQFESLMRTLAGTIGDLLMPALTFFNDLIAKNPQLVQIAVPIILGLAAALGIAAIAVWAMNSAMLANPLFWIIAGITLIVVGLVLLATKTTFFQDVWHAMTDAVMAAWDWLWSGIKSVLSAGMTLLTSLVKAGVDKVMAAWRMLSSLPGTISGWFGEAKTAAVGKMVALVAWLKGLPGRVLDAVGDLGNILVNAGKAIIKGLIRGVMSMLGTLKSKFSSITSMIPDLKGPMTLDLKLLTPSGEAIMSGLMDGVDNEIPGFEKQLAGVTGSIPSNINTSVSSAASSSASRQDTLKFVGSEDDFNQFLRRSVQILGGGSVQKAYGQGI
jgi:hypothetical protein